VRKLIVLVSGLMLCASLFAVINITKTRVEVNGTLYECKGDTDLFEARDLGNISSLTLNGALTNSGTSGASIAYMYYRLNGVDWLTLGLDNKTTASTPPAERGSIDPESEGNNIAINSLMKTLSDIDSFTRSTDLNVDLSGLTNGVTYDFEVFHKILGVTEPVDTSVSVYTATFTKIADIGFTDGSGFTPSVTLGNTSELIGLFQLDADISGASLTGVSIDLEGTRTGFSNFKLWASDDNKLDIGVDEYIRTVEVDPGASPAVYSSFSISIPTEGVYLLLTADVDLEATGNIQGVISEVADLSVSNGEINGTISSAVMSNGGAEIPTPIELVSFTAEADQGNVQLAWTTASETENSHFLVYRDGEVIATIGGHGTTTEPHSYNYTDTRVRAGNHSYAIADVTLGGLETVHAPAMIEIREEIELNDFVLGKAYPNPFNPCVTINFQLSTFNEITAVIYNTSGELIKELIKSEMTPGSYDLTWDASGMPSGVYIVKMIVGNVVQSQKIVLMK
jgi:Secretion system C-terminal sorting domain